MAETERLSSIHSSTARIIPLASRGLYDPMPSTSAEISQTSSFHTLQDIDRMLEDHFKLEEGFE